MLVFDAGIVLASSSWCGITKARVGAAIAGGSLAIAWPALGARAAAPEDPVVMEEQEEEGDDDGDRITFVAGPEGDDEPLRIHGPATEEAEGAQGGRVEVRTQQSVVVQTAEPEPVCGSACNRASRSRRSRPRVA